MNIDKIVVGNKAPEEFNTIIEITAGSNPVKYELDKESGALIIDRLVATPMYYPCNYGFVPHTLAGDGDPLDTLVLTPMNIMPGTVINVRPIGVLNLTDEKGEDAKIICVPVSKITTYYDKIKTYQDLPELFLKQLSHFFERYKDLEEGKWVKIQGFKGIDEAKSIIKESIENYKA